jgi:iron(III) transport system ATP-binding protein
VSFLVLHGLTKRYGGTLALDNVDLTVAAGSRTAVVGPSGSGKTTLLRIIAGFEAPDRGRVVLDGAVLADGRTALPAHRRGIGVVAQDGALFPHLTVGENIGFGLPRSDPGRSRRITMLAEQVGLDTAMLARRPDQLSGGQQQRVALARALARAPRLMLLDEPFSALDTGLRANMRKVVADLMEEAGIATVLVTHDQTEALSFAHQVAVLRAGRLVQAGEPRTLYAHPCDRELALFLGDALLTDAEVVDGIAHCLFGIVTVAGGSRRGRAEIMLRPEQVTLKPDPAGPGIITAVEFGGSTCVYTVRIDGSPTPITIRQLASEVLRPTTAVRITVTGKAHILPG